MQKLALERLQEGVVIPAHPLALNADRQIDEKRQRALTNYYLYAGAGGLAVGVHTTQFEIRSPEHALFEPVLQMASEEIISYEKRCGASIVKIAGVCGSEKQAAAEAETARQLGYDAVLLSPGGLSDLTEAELLQRTRTVASILPVVGFYLQPSVGGRVFTYDYWQQFCEIENVIAIKCAAFNRYQTLDVVRAAAFSSRSAQIALYTGNDDNIVIDLRHFKGQGYHVNNAVSLFLKNHISPSQTQNPNRPVMVSFILVSTAIISGYDVYTPGTILFYSLYTIQPLITTQQAKNQVKNPEQVRFLDLTSPVS